MFMGEAKRLCPDLVVLPYEFDKYQAASEKARGGREEGGGWGGGGEGVWAGGGVGGGAGGGVGETTEGNTRGTIAGMPLPLLPSAHASRRLCHHHLQHRTLPSPPPSPPSPAPLPPQVYRILMAYSSCVQPISCDEAFLDVTGLLPPASTFPPAAASTVGHIWPGSGSVVPARPAPAGSEQCSRAHVN